MATCICNRVGKRKEEGKCCFGKGDLYVMYSWWGAKKYLGNPDPHFFSLFFPQRKSNEFIIHQSERIGLSHRGIWWGPEGKLDVKWIRERFGRRSNSSLVVQCPATLFILIPPLSRWEHTRAGRHKGKEGPQMHGWQDFTWSRVLITSAGVTREAAGTPAMAPAKRSVRGEL